ncbi:hypothetical protein JB92DRAFT_2799119 [Gautieria morchelliformis]|nr:hypothetical protein JB92DRAFT_2799119 [Gautieria morchelliformis]
MTMTTTTEFEPPAYTVSSTGFPPGYFVVRNISTGKVLDVELDGKHDGAEVVMFPEKETSHVLGFRDATAENQVFFVDYLGSLCSKASGHAVDVEGDGRLVLRHRRPVVMPFPNRLSHPFPQLHYSATSGQISVSFSYDPAYPGRDRASAGTWRDRTYLLTSVPARKPRGLLDDASDFFQGAATAISAPFAMVLGTNKPDPSASASVAEVQRGEFDLREDELSEVDRAEEDGIDDSPDPLRRVRVISLASGVSNDVGPMARERRRWEVIPLLKAKAMTGTI